MAKGWEILRQQASAAKSSENDIKNKKAFHVTLNKEDFKDKSESPFTPTSKYNYQVNINHPAITPHYQKYKEFIGEAMILSDNQRLDFEKYILNEFRRLGIRKEDYTNKFKSKTKKTTSWSYDR